jgi:hypothetical protein
MKNDPAGAEAALAAWGLLALRFAPGDYVDLMVDVFQIAADFAATRKSAASGHGTNPLARECAARGSEQVVRVVLTK